jgi:hypothetical protein
LLNARIQAIDLRPVTARWSGPQRLVLKIGEIDGDALSVIAGLRGSLRSLVFVLLLGLQATPAAIFDTREACTAYASAKLELAMRPSPNSK